jgi:DNA-binding transcriptional ArsR family regulator/glycerol uptake facilitator-like aquaporin
MAEILTADPGLQVLQNALATAGALTAVILALGPVSGAHLNPAVTLADRAFGGLTNRETVGYVAAQITGGVAGVVNADLMFDLPAVTWSATSRSGSHLWLAEAVATVGLLVVIFGLVRSGRASLAAFAVGAYIAGAGYFASSTSFAIPPSPLLAPFATPSPGSNQPASAPGFAVAELVAGATQRCSSGRCSPTSRTSPIKSSSPTPNRAHGRDRTIEPGRCDLRSCHAGGGIAHDPQVTSTNLETTTVESRAATFAALSDPIRLSVLDQLGREQRCVCDLQEALGIAPNLLSYHLRILRQAGLVESTRRGRWVDYRLSADAAALLTRALPSLLVEAVSR